MVKNDLLSPLLGLVIFSFSYADYGLHPRPNIFHSFGVPFPYGCYQGLRLTPKPLSVFFHAFGVSKTMEYASCRERPRVVPQNNV